MFTKDDSEGQLGLGNYAISPHHTTPRFYRYQINILTVVCGSEHTILLSGYGNLYAMGSNKFGQIGLVRKDN